MAELTQELNTFLGLLHKEEDYKIYEDYLLEGDMDELELEIQKVTQAKNTELSVIYSESEVSTHRENNHLNDIFQMIYKDIQIVHNTQNLQVLADSKLKLMQLQSSIAEYLDKLQSTIIELNQHKFNTDTNNKLLIEALNSAQQEIQILQKKCKQYDDESIIKLKKQLIQAKKQNDEMQSTINQLQKDNQALQKQLKEQETTYKNNDEEFRDASNRLIKSNQALREIIVNMGTLSPFNQNKLKEVINYLTNGSDSSVTRTRSVSKSKNSKDNQQLYQTLTTQRHQKSVSPQDFSSARKPFKESDQNRVNILDSSYQTSYKELFLKSLQKITKQVR